VGILVESDPDNNRFVLQIPVMPDNPNRVAWEMSWDEEKQCLVLVKENCEAVPCTESNLGKITLLQDS
jgi:hypothetical protein